MATTLRNRRWLIGLGAVALAAVVGWRVHSHLNRGLSAPPEIDLAGVDASVAKAVQAARDQVAATRDSAEAWGQLGMVLHAHRFAAEARICYAEAERHDGRDPRWPYLQALLQLSAAPEEAVPQLRRAVELAGDQSDAPRLRLADLLLQLDERAEAEQLYRALLDHRSDHVRARLGLARVAAISDNAPKALRYLEPCLADPRTRKAALTLHGELLGRAGDAAAAERDLDEARRLPPDQPWPDPWVQAVSKLKRGERQRRESAGRLIDIGRVEEAVAELENLTRENPESPDNWMLLGYALLQAQQYPAAEPCLKRAIALDAQLPQAWLYLGVVQYHQKDRPAAAASLRRAIQVKPDYALAYHNLGLVLTDAGDRPGAIEAFQTSLRCQPRQAAAHAKLGELLAQAGLRGEAAAHLRQAVELNPADRRSQELLTEMSKH
ncbi:MAG: tetratricopeptide repeat protein [Gemmataceae bacterium]